MDLEDIEEEEEQFEVPKRMGIYQELKVDENSL